MSGGGVARAFLSDRYKIIDSLDVLMAALDGIRQVGVPVTIAGCDLAESRMHVRVVPDAVTALAPAVCPAIGPFTGLAGADNPVVFGGFVLASSETAFRTILDVICDSFGESLSPDLIAAVPKMKRSDFRKMYHAAQEWESSYEAPGKPPSHLRPYIAADNPAISGDGMSVEMSFKNADNIKRYLLFSHSIVIQSTLVNRLYNVIGPGLGPQLESLQNHFVTLRAAIPARGRHGRGTITLAVIAAPSSARATPGPGPVRCARVTVNGWMVSPGGRRRSAGTWRMAVMGFAGTALASW